MADWFVRIKVLYILLALSILLIFMYFVLFYSGLKYKFYKSLLCIDFQTKVYYEVVKYIITTNNVCHLFKLTSTVHEHVK